MSSKGQRIAVTFLTLLAGSAHCFRATLYSEMDCQGEEQDAWVSPTLSILPAPTVLLA